jgi:hypothetical protein
MGTSKLQALVRFIGQNDRFGIAIEFDRFAAPDQTRARYSSHDSPQQWLLSACDKSELPGQSTGVRRATEEENYLNWIPAIR